MFLLRNKLSISFIRPLDLFIYFQHKFGKKLIY